MRAVALLVIFGLCHDLSAGSFDVTVKDGKGALVSDAVVYAKETGMTAAEPKKQTVIDQQDKQFIPYVTARAGRYLDPVSEQGQHSPSRLFVVVREKI